LAPYPYLWETTVVRQAIETAWTSVSSGGHSLSYWCQQRRFRIPGLSTTCRSPITRPRRAWFQPI